MYMKKIVVSLITVATLFVMLVPTTSPLSVAAAGASVDFKQYANEDGEWIGSILQASNSKYYECMSVPQRTILANIPPTEDGVHTLTFSHETTKGGIHAYDWLTAYDQENELPLAFNACGEKFGHTPDFATICGDLHSSGYSISVPIPDDPFISKDGSTQARINAYEAEFGNRQIKIYGDQSFAAAGMTLSHTVSSGGDTGDSDIEYFLTWTSNSTQILIEMAGHLAVSGDPAANPIAWGAGLGASYVSGGPYHFKLDKLDGASLGSQDNPIKGADVLERVGTIVAHKFSDLNGNGIQDAGEADLEDWTMTLYEGSNCSGDALASGTTDVNGDVVFDGLEAGTYSVRETLEGGWTNSTELCQQTTVEVGETVTLNFGNVELKPDIDVEKTASPTSGAASTNVTFTITVENTGDLTLDPVTVVDTLPDGMSYVSDDAGGTQSPEGTITWDIGSLDPGNTTTIHLVAHIDGDVLGTLTNSVTATGTPPYGDDVEDTDTADVEAYHAGIHVDKTADPGCGGPSANITFTIVVTNTNGSVLDPVIVVDTLPDGMSYVSDDAGGTESPEGTIAWDLGSLPSGNSTTIHLVASIDGDELGTLTNTVTATGTPPEGDDVEDTDTADVLAIDAKISISPPDDTNVVGDEHILTANVQVDDGTGWDDYEGATVSFEVTSGPGDLDPVTDVTDTSGQATTTLTSTVAGNSTITASTSICGYDISTDGTANNSDPAEKEWVYARIKIDPPEDTNVVGDLHGLTATVETSTNNITWDPYEGATVTFEVTSGPGDLDPDMAVTNSSGQATTTLTSTEAGNSTVTASTTVYDHDLSTDGEAYNSDPAEKEWVYARIRITPPDDTNLVGDPHGFTATVETSTDGTNWDPYAGASVAFEVTDGPGDLDPEIAVTNSSGQATTTLISTETGTTTVKASTTVYDHDLSTNGEAYNSGPAEKDWVDARISIFESGVNRVGQAHDFTVTVESCPGDGTGWVPAAGINVTPTHSGVGSITSTGPYVTDSSGQVTITVNSNVTGTAIVHASATVSIDDIDIDVATNGYGAYEPIGNTKTWTDIGGYTCGCCDTCDLTVDWEGYITTRPLHCSNDKLAVDCLGPSFDLSHSLFLRKGTHAPVVDETTYYLIVVRELEDIPPLPQNTEAIVVFQITPTDAVFDKDIFLTLGLNETQLPQNALDVTMDYYDDIEGVWVPLEFEAGGPNGVAELTFSAPINHFSIYGILAELDSTPTPPAHFVPGSLTISPSVEKTIFVTTTGETVTITANIANDGGQEGTYDVALKLNEQTVDTKTVTVGAGQSKQVSFTQSGLGYGQYEVEVAGLTGEFTASRTIAWWLIILIIVAVGLIIWGVVWARRRRKAQQEA
jgi:uncharacterized repeat protein (TIGR01451 family)